MKAKPLINWGNFYKAPTEVYIGETKEDCLKTVGGDKNYVETCPVVIIPCESLRAAHEIVKLYKK